MAGYFVLCVPGDPGKDMFGAGKDGFSDGDPPTVLPTQVPPAHLNMQFREINNAVVLLDGVLNTAQDNQLGTQILAKFNDILLRMRWSDWSYMHSTALTGGTPIDIIATRGQAFVQLTTKTQRVGRGLVVTDSAVVPNSPKWGGAARHGYMYHVFDGTVTNDIVTATITDTFVTGSVAGNQESANIVVNYERTKVYWASRSTGNNWRVDSHNDASGDVDTGAAALGSSAGTLGHQQAGLQLFAANGRIVASGTTTTSWIVDTATTSDSWTHNTHSTLAAYTLYPAAVRSGAGAILIRASASGYAKSTDWGVSWTTHSLPAGLTISDLKSDDIDFYMAGDIGGKPTAFVSRDGVTWAQRPLPRVIGTAPKLALEIMDTEDTGVRPVGIWVIGSANLVMRGRAS